MTSVSRALMSSSSSPSGSPSGSAPASLSSESCTWGSSLCGAPPWIEGPGGVFSGVITQHTSENTAVHIARKVSTKPV
eukprot:CAMPEP_0167789450 /NCGR_PEP_ID=MMETSP0111_2-20121227/10694_1 /TAXON_ID=91324 /ORGANISM="Lotharella globosa, Strain CCCM811" /LENGTH=77 /DNA_ID=CAMNT_0007681623 /DNA_START=182 /DNA_END=415 /DNA_ORIENTATION=-